MKVSSPVGDFPFTVERVRVHRGGVTVAGRMGRWPAEVQVDTDDLLAIGRRARGGLIAVGVVAAACAATARRSRRA